MRNNSGIIHLWQGVPYLAQLAQPILDELAASAISQTCTAGELIFLEGDAVPNLYLIERGTVKISRFSKEGREHIVHLLTRGDTFNDVAALDGGPTPATATAHTEAVLWYINRDVLRTLAHRHPSLAWAILEGMARRARHLVNVLQDFSMRNVKGRLARLLLDEMQVGDEQDGTLNVLTQEEIASRLSTVREVIGRALRSLSAAGLIQVDRQRIVILDPERLAEEAEI